MFMSDELLGEVASFLMACERLGYWPGSICHAVLHLIPKREGGARTIGMVEGMRRLWERARRDIVRSWRATHCIDYDF